MRLPSAKNGGLTWSRSLHMQVVGSTQLPAATLPAQSTVTANRQASSWAACMQSGPQSCLLLRSTCNVQPRVGVHSHVLGGLGWPPAGPHVDRAELQAASGGVHCQHLLAQCQLGHPFGPATGGHGSRACRLEQRLRLSMGDKLPCSSSGGLQRDVPGGFCCKSTACEVELEVAALMSSHASCILTNLLLHDIVPRPPGKHEARPADTHVHLLLVESAESHENSMRPAHTGSTPRLNRQP